MKGFYYSFIPTSKQRSMNECLCWALKHKCPLNLQLQQVNRLHQRLVLLIKAHTNKMSKLESFQTCLERQFFSVFQLYMIYNKWIWTVTLLCFLYGELFFMGAVCIEVYELMELCDMWPVRLFFQPDRRSESCWTGSRSQPSHTVLFHSQISVYIKNPL